MKTLVTIDPLSIDNRDVLNLFVRLVNNNPSRTILVKNKHYSVSGNIFSLTHTVLCKVDAQNKPVYQILSNQALFKAGKTDKTDVYPIEKIFRIIRNKCIYSEPSEPLIAKCQFVRTTDKKEITKRQMKMTHEYKASTDGHLAAENPRFAHFKMRTKKNPKVIRHRFFGVAVQKKCRVSIFLT